MFGLMDQLRLREKPIGVGIIGIGSIGRGMMLQADTTPGIRCLAVADIRIDRAISAAQRFNREHHIVEDSKALYDTLAKGKLAICEDGELLARCEMLDVVIEATNSVAAGARYGLTSLEHNTHVVMMNYEADLMFGAMLMKRAEERGLVYTVCDGDQPAVLKRLIDEMTFMGFQPVMAGNMKGFLDRYVNPTSIIPEADKRNLDYHMCTSYTDGTKLSVEMAVVANGLGMRTAIPGMIGPRVQDIYQVFDHFNFSEIWDGNRAVVDYVLGAKPVGGVFAIGYTDNAYQQETLDWFPPKMGPGPFYLFYRPYHLGHFESMASVAEAVINRRPVLRPAYGLRTNVYAYAKRDLRRGDVLDGIGGFACYGMIENCIDNETRPGLPICLSEKVRLNRDIPKDAKILLRDVDYNPEDFTFALFREAENLSRAKLL